MALTLDDADAMIRSCDAHGIKLFVVKQNRFNVPVVKLREPWKGPLRQARARHSARCAGAATGLLRPGRMARHVGAGRRVLSNQASHHVDLLEWMMGDVESVFARGATALVDIEAETRPSCCSSSGAAHSG